VLIFLLALPITGGAQATIFDRDDRVVVLPASTKLYAPIGVVRHKGRHSTGFLINECDVLTVKHVLRDISRGVGERVRFDAPMAKNIQSSFGTIIAAGLYGARSQYRTDDWLVVRLDSCLGKELGYVRLSTSVPFVRMGNGDVLASVSSAGFPVDHRRNGVTIDRSCKIVGKFGLEWLHDCATLPGNSGSPLFREVRSGRGIHLEAVAIVTAGQTKRKPIPYDVKFMNWATPVAALLSQIPKRDETLAIEIPRSRQLRATA
jgi:V8-like Glu-specific endopeptidase